MAIMSIFQEEKSDAILEKALAGERISDAEALELYESGDVLKIQGVARTLRGRKIDPSRASYTIFRIVNYTNSCNIDCTFCSYKEEIDSGKKYLLSTEEVIEKMEQVFDSGVNQLFFQGGVDPTIPFDYYLNTFVALKERFGPTLHIRAFSPVELLMMEEVTKKPLASVLEELKEAGLDSVPGAGAEILTERMRRLLSPKKSPVAEWVRVMETCHEHGLPGTANIVFGSEETAAEVIEHLALIRSIQDRTGGFLSFIPWTFQRQTKRFFVRNVPAHEYLKVVGISRIFLDNIDHIESSILVLGPGVGGLALHSGADDMSSVVIEENVLRSHSFKTEEKARQFLTENGFTPVRRDFLYRDVEAKSAG